MTRVVFFFFKTVVFTIYVLFVQQNLGRRDTDDELVATDVNVVVAGDGHEPDRTCLFGVQKYGKKSTLMRKIKGLVLVA